MKEVEVYIPNVTIRLTEVCEITRYGSPSNNIMLGKLCLVSYRYTTIVKSDKEKPFLVSSELIYIDRDKRYKTEEEARIIAHNTANYILQNILNLK